MEPQKIVIRYGDGKIVKGHTSNFSPMAPSFILHLLSPEGQSSTVTVEIVQLKAIFFVHDFAGNPRYKDKPSFEDKHPYMGRPVEVHLKDGEVMQGYTPNYDPSMPGFFVFSADPQSNMIKAFVINSFVKSARLM